MSFVIRRPSFVAVRSSLVALWSFKHPNGKPDDAVHQLEQEQERSIIQLRVMAEAVSAEGEARGCGG